MASEPHADAEGDVNMSRNERDRETTVMVSHDESVLATTLALLTLTGGGTVFECLVAVATHGQGDVQRMFTNAVTSVESGQDLDNVLRRLARDHGPHVRPLMLTLQIIYASGVSNTEAIVELQRLEQHKRRNELERRVHRLPTLMLMPMIGCFLPAFVVLTLIPILLVTLSGVFSLFPNT